MRKMMSTKSHIADKMADPDCGSVDASAQKRLCPHCDRHLSWSAFNDHMALFYHQEMSSWKREAKVSVGAAY